MIFKTTNPFDLDKINLLSESDKVRYLEFLSRHSEGAKIPTRKVLEDDNIELLTELAMVGLIQKTAVEKNYWEHEKWFLTEKDFAKLNEKYDESVIKDYILKFKNWDHKSKNSRTNILGSIRKWMERDKVWLTKEQVDYISSSFDKYVKHGKINNANFTEFQKKMDKLFSKGETIDDLKLFFNKEFNYQLSNNSEGYRKLPENVLDNYETWKKFGR